MRTRPTSRRIRRVVLSAVMAVGLTAATIVGFTGTAQAGPFSAPATQSAAQADGPGVLATYYQLIARHSGKCLHVVGGSTANGADIVQYTCLGVGHQRWQLQDIGDGYFLIKVAHSGKCLDVSGQRDVDGANVHQYTCHAEFNQQWRRVTLSSGYSNFVARHSGKCLEVDNASLSNSIDAQQWTCNGNRNQQWEVAQ